MIDEGPFESIYKCVHIDRIYQFEHLLLHIDNHNADGPLLFQNFPEFSHFRHLGGGEGHLILW